MQTRYRLENEIQNENTLWKQVLLETVSKINVYIQVSRTYTEKVEIQCEKYITSEGENEDISFFVDTVMDEDYCSCKQATECLLQLESHRVTLLSDTGTSLHQEQKKTEHVSELRH